MGIPYEHFALDRLPRVRLLTIGWYDPGPGEWHLRRAINAHWTYYCNDRDGAVLRTPMGEVPLRAGQLVLIPGSCRYDAICPVALRHMFGFFDLPGLLHQRSLSVQQPLAVPSVDDGILKELLAQPGVNLSPHQNLRLVACLNQAVAHVLPPEAFIAGDSVHDLILPACRIIDQSYAKPISNAELAAACGMSLTTFLRHFRKATGTTPTQVLRIRRVQAAALELERGATSLDAVAATSGFPNRAYLSRVFQAVLGMPPSAYRKRHQRPDVAEWAINRSAG